MLTERLERNSHLLFALIEDNGKFRNRGTSLVFLLKLLDGLLDLSLGTYLIERKTYNTRLLGQCLQDGLADPPHSIRDELKTAGFVELLSSFDKA